MSAGTTFKAACVQLTSSDDLQDNIARAGETIRAAAAASADLIMTPENTPMVTPRRAHSLANAHPEASHPAVAAFSALAAELGRWLLVGSATIKLGPETCANRSLLFAPDGTVAARYDKIHMFDVEIPDGQTYRESATFRPGRQAVLAELPWGRLGMTVCYDLRFAALYRSLAQAGASFLSVPAAFTEFTGRAHWHVLLRARAIETGCFVFAPAQCGLHAGERRTYGHSLIVAPWGEVLADGGEEPGFVTAEIDTAKVAEARRMVPSLQHDRPFAPPATPEEEALRQAGE
ncbi:Predicted amidohydrolase [Tistlia consotensis]|uniref:Predicted amidohydrolase n=1 Tax=Tistlia consotensis USBA 355 TaxID=560819 RepID=A0A1Y6BY68_9PROT|nr:carbon-nitrogen hydrolase family protein [Tistlia consotensis]SMF33669.1 Predicted amidohydrolase [Tistlia consotensis USBA 355]SNR70091.1 Predicted amidohydrolase [Tistlia consotensis]